MPSTHVDALLLIYHHPLSLNAPTIMDHVGSFARFSRYPVISVNTEYGFDRKLRRLRFPVIVLHYSLFGEQIHLLNNRWYEFLQNQKAAYKIAFFQDEFHGCQKRFAFLNRFEIDCVYSLYDPQYWDQVYGQHTCVKTLRHTLTGYVSDDLCGLAARYSLPQEQRSIDIGYRARKLPYYMGRGAQEKWEIGQVFLDRAQQMGLKVDISWEESRRIYGDDWFRFLGNCRGALGTESGVSITDLDGHVFERCEAAMRDDPRLTFEQISQTVLQPFENNIPLRTISPRCLEAAAMGCCQILYEGHYNGILQPMVHYLPLKKDLSNLDEIISLFRDPDVRETITRAAYDDLIASGRYSYRMFVQDFDDQLDEIGLLPRANTVAVQAVAEKLRRRQSAMRMRRRIVLLAQQPLKLIRPVVHRFPLSWRRWVTSKLGMPHS